MNAKLEALFVKIIYTAKLKLEKESLKCSIYFGWLNMQTGEEHSQLLIPSVANCTIFYQHGKSTSVMLDVLENSAQCSNNLPHKLSKGVAKVTNFILNGSSRNLVKANSLQ